MLRRVRIAATVFFAVVGSALVVLWSTSYLGLVTLRGPLPMVRSITIQSFHGSFGVHFGRPDAQCVASVRRYAEMIATEDGKPVVNPNTFAWTLARAGRFSFRIPFWLPVIGCGAVLAALWIPRQFSLRTVLVAMTLTAVALALIVYVLG